MTHKDWFEDDDLVTNPSPRIPVCLVLDTSFSMDGAPIDTLNQAIGDFFNEIKSDIQTAASCEISIVSFNTTARIVSDFTSIYDKKIEKLTCTGSTNMHLGVELALNILEKRKDEYKLNGIDYYQPWLIIMSDGHPNNPQSLRPLQEEIRTLESNRKIMIIPVGIGEEANLEILSLFSNKNPGAFSLKGLKFKEFFNFISKSMETISRSKPGEKAKIPVELIREWAEL